MAWNYFEVACYLYIAIFIFKQLFIRLIDPILEFFKPETVDFPAHLCMNGPASEKELMQVYARKRPAFQHLRKFRTPFNFYFWRKDFTVVSSIFSVYDGGLHSYMRHYTEWNQISPEMKQEYNSLPQVLKADMRAYAYSADKSDEYKINRAKIQDYLNAQPNDSRVLGAIARIEVACLAHIARMVRSYGNFIESRTKFFDSRESWVFALNDNFNMRLIFGPKFGEGQYSSSKNRPVFKLITAFKERRVSD